MPLPKQLTCYAGYLKTSAPLSANRRRAQQVVTPHAQV